jgi:outer membrane protein assembly factor BamB
MIAWAATAFLVNSVSAADWPAWRGPTGQGYSDEKNLPLKWSKTENVKWKVPLAYPGNSTPVVFGDKIFMTQANKGGSVRGLLCMARADGKILWQKDISYDAKERNWNENWYCNASPAVDGKRIIVSHGSAGVYCYDFDGNLMWKRDDLGRWEHAFGNSASPVLYGDLCILWCGPNENKGRNFLIAVNKADGKTVWEKDESFGSWSTPLIVPVDGKDQMLLSMSRDVKKAPDEQTGVLKGYDPKTGKELWHCRGVNSYAYASPLYSNGVAVQMAGYGGSAIGVKLGGSGDITKDRLWLHPRAVQRVGTGIILGEHIYMVDENCLPHCYELTTGKDLWQGQFTERPAGTTWSSLVHAEGRLYLLTKQGDTHVFAASPKYQLLATNRLGEPTNASVVPHNGELLLRTERNLWCIAEKK